jgi:DNA-directed RNA polymerase specialized sigma24 family protein
MSDFNSGVGGPGEIDPEWAGDAETLYRRHRTLLISVAVGMFRVPKADAENLIHEVLLTFVQHRKRIAEARDWLVAAISNASRHYRRSRRRRALPDRVGERAYDNLAQELDTMDRELEVQFEDYIGHADFADRRTGRSMSVLELFVSTYANL